MRTLNLTIALLLLQFIFVRCNNTTSSEKHAQEKLLAFAAPVTVNEEGESNFSDITLPNAPMEEELPPPPPELKLNHQNTNTTKESKLIKDGDVSMICKNVYKSKKRFDRLIEENKGYYSNEKLAKNEEELIYELEIRIPSSHFEKVVSEIEKGTDEITEKNINTRDVSEEYYDLETRLENKKAYLKRYREILNKANSIRDILAIEENIRTVQEEIESSLGRLNYLKDQIGYSTLNIYLTTKIKHNSNISSPTFFSKIANSLRDGIDLVLNFVLWIISIWPIDVIILFLIYWLLRRKRKNKLLAQ